MFTGEREALNYTQMTWVWGGTYLFHYADLSRRESR